MNETLNTIFNRRSIRAYTDKEIDDQTVALLLKAGMYAPSAVNTQPWQFVVIKDKKSMEEVMKVHPYSKMLKTANVLIVVCADQKSDIQKAFFQQDLGACTENILLAAKSLGIGSVWLGVYPNNNLAKDIAKIFSIPEDIVPFGLISLGYPAEERATPERFDKAKIHNEKW